MSIAVFGGSFDPVHNAHIELASAVMQELAPDLLVVIPAYIQPFKQDKIPESAEDRMSMLKLAFSGFKACEISEYEIEKADISYSIDTLRHMRQRAADASDKIYFVLGSDSLMSIEKWMNGTELLKEFSLVVGNRPGEDIEKTHSYIETLKNRYGADIFMLDARIPNVSSTDIRTFFHEGCFERLRELLPETVLYYIIAKGLYGGAGSCDDCIGYGEKSRLIGEILRYIAVRLTGKRFLHTLRVCEMALELAKIHGADSYDAIVASLLHDVARSMDVNELDALIRHYGVDMNYIADPKLAHSKVGERIAYDVFDIRNEDVLNAISYHTTGRAGMSRLEMLIYLADAIERGRRYKEADKLRESAFSDSLEEACMKCLAYSIEYLKGMGIPIHEDTIEAYEFLKGACKMESKEMAVIATDFMDEKKALEVCAIDIAEKSGFADYFVMATGMNTRHLDSLANDLEAKFAKYEIYPKNIEGKGASGWILMDYGDLVINILTAEMREKYSIEKLWADCEKVLCKGVDNE